MTIVSDVYDVGRAVWCELCDEAHSPCEERDLDNLPNYCGCCGQPYRDEGIRPWFCEKCMAHVLDDTDNQGGYRHIWDCTWIAQYGTDCPYQDKPNQQGSDR